MKTSPIVDAAIVLLLAAMLSASHLLDDIESEYSQRVAGQQAAIDAERAAQQAARFERAAQAMCGGENAAWELLPDGAVQCRTKRGHKTITAQVQP